MGEWQLRQRPRRTSQLRRGIFSHQARAWGQLRQWELGWTTLSPWGQRVRQTLRKLPKARPKSALKTRPSQRMSERKGAAVSGGRGLMRLS
jgi:hypothetical protein